MKTSLALLFAASLATVLAVDEPPAQGRYPVESSKFRDKPADSYSNSKDASGRTVYPIWGQAPFFDFGSRKVEFDPTGMRPIPQAPAPGVHPRIFFGPEELPAVRDRLKNTRTGQAAWNNILSWTEAVKGTYDDSAPYAAHDVWKGGFGGLRGPVPLYRLGLPENPGKSKYNRSEPAAALYEALADGTATEMPDYYWNAFALEAFRALIENDRAAAEKLAAATMTGLKLGQAKREEQRRVAQAKKPNEPLPPVDQPIGRFQLAFIYDFLFPHLKPEQKDALRSELAATTWSHDNYGTFNTAESARSNWATFSYWLYQVLAIEGEEGFNDLKVRGMYRGWRNLLTYGWFQSGATFEGEAKNQLGLDGILLFASREKDYGFENLGGHPYLQAYARKFLPHSINPMLSGFHKYDLLGGSRAGSGGFAPMDSLGLKYLFPEDKVIDWYYRKTVGENYEGVPDRPDGYFNALLFYAIYATDFDPKNNDPKALNLGHTFFCGERSLLMTRSSWEPDAAMLNLHTRGANGGHAFSDRNAIMVAGAGRIWSPNGYSSFHTKENSVVSINGRNQDLNTPARMVDFVDTPTATFAVGDAKHAWDWQWKRLEKPNGYYTKKDIDEKLVKIPEGYQPVLQTMNDFALTKLPHEYLNRPIFEYSHWIQPDGALSPYVRTPLLPVQHAIRTAGLIRGKHPYMLVIDDIQVDGNPQRFDWTLALEPDIQIVSTTRRSDTEFDVVLTGFDPEQTLPRTKGKPALPAQLEDPSQILPGQPMLLVRVVNASGNLLEPTIVEEASATEPKKYGRVRRLVLTAESVSPAFKVLLFPYRQGSASFPETEWNAARDTLTVQFDGQKDTIAFRPALHGKTDVRLSRDGQILAEVKAPMPPPLE